VDPAEHLADVERWHATRVARLTAPDGWLSLAGLFWLSPGENPVGSDPSNAVVLPRGPTRLGTVDLRDGLITGRFDPSAGATVDGSPATALELSTDAQGATPTMLRLGAISFYVIDREGRPAVRVKDADNPARSGFVGIDRFPVDLAWRLEARFEEHPPGSTVLAPDVLGRGQTYRNPGAVTFTLWGREHRLEAFREPNEDDLFIVFGDLTNGALTFDGGRYLYAGAPDGDGIVVVDFNRAYNPPCVFTPFATCVLPLPENHLPVPIEAGERRYGDH
jgi:uncharacterized protein (DUF1684 family)